MQHLQVSPWTVLCMELIPALNEGMSSGALYPQHVKAHKGIVAIMACGQPCSCIGVTLVT